MEMVFFFVFIEIYAIMKGKNNAKDNKLFHFFVCAYSTSVPWFFPSNPVQTHKYIKAIVNLLGALCAFQVNFWHNFFGCGARRIQYVRMYAKISLWPLEPKGIFPSSNICLISVKSSLFELYSYACLLANEIKLEKISHFSVFNGKLDVEIHSFLLSDDEK